MRKFTNLFFLFLLVFIGFFSDRFAVSTHIDSDVTMSYSIRTAHRSFLPRNLWFPAEKPMVSRQETFKTHVALKLQGGAGGESAGPSSGLALL